MKLIEYGANAVSNYDYSPAFKDVVFYRYAYLDLVCFKDKCLFHTEVDMAKSKYFCLGIQFGGDALVRFSGNIYRVGFEISLWGYS